MPDARRIDAARAAADALSSRTPERRLLAGFDGFIDRLIDVVDERRSPSDYTRIATIDAFAQRAAAAAGRSANLELVIKEERLGGNGAILAMAAASLGAQTRFVGAVGEPPNVEPVFEPLARIARVATLGPPGRTDALEFDDGKLMLGQPQALGAITFDRVAGALGGEAEFARELDGAICAMGNWTMTPAMTDIWRRLAERVLPAVDCAGVFIDLADPAKRSDGDLREAVDAMRAMNERAPVTLGLNLAESARLARLLGGSRAARDESAGDLGALEETASSLQRETGLSAVAAHTRRGAAIADSAGVSSMAGPFVRRPRVSTGAGDHFNAGVCVARALDLERDAQLALGLGASGLFVRAGASPRPAELAEFLRDLPEPEA